jgi:hypothetical protein
MATSMSAGDDLNHASCDVGRREPSGNVQILAASRERLPGQFALALSWFLFIVDRPMIQEQILWSETIALVSTRPFDTILQHDH